MAQNHIIKIQNLTQRLMNSSLLVLDKEISFFLSEIASDKTLKQIVSDSNHNYSFEDDWHKLQQKKEIILPHNKKQKIAYIIGLFYKLDIKELSSIDMLKTFYPHCDNLQSAYDLFSKDIIISLQEAFIALLRGEPIEQEQPQPTYNPILDKMNEDIKHWLALILSSLSAYSLNEDAEKELTFTLKGFYSILDHNDIDLIKLIWLGLKNTFYKYNIVPREIMEIEKLFATYGLNMEIN